MRILDSYYNEILLNFMFQIISKDSRISADLVGPFASGRYIFTRGHHERGKFRETEFFI